VKEGVKRHKKISKSNLHCSLQGKVAQSKGNQRVRVWGRKGKKTISKGLHSIKSSYGKKNLRGWAFREGRSTRDLLWNWGKGKRVIQENVGERKGKWANGNRVLNRLSGGGGGNAKMR